MTELLIVAWGLVSGLAAHDLAAQALSESEPLRPFSGSCPRCRTRRSWLTRVCPECGRRIRREALVVVAAGSVALGFWVAAGQGWLFIPYALFLVLSLALLLTDIDDFRIVDRLNLRGTLLLTVVLASVALVEGMQTNLFRGLMGALAYFGGSFVLYAIVRGRGFGGGDVKLSFQLGLMAAFISWGTLGWAVFATAVIGGLLALLMVLFSGAGRDTELPYGPAMILGTWLAIILAGIGAFPLPT